jgi:hypothetical protein
MRKFSFDESRALNSLIDYETYLRSKTRFQKSFIEENNPLSIYTIKKNNGIILMTNATNNLVDYLITDSYGNSSTLQFTLTGLKPTTTSPKVKSKIDTIFSYKNVNIFDKQNIRMEIPKDALYKNLEFEFQIKDTMRGAITPTYQLHNDYTPLHDYITISIKPGRISETLRSKAIVVNIDRNGRFYSRGGEWRNNYLTAKSKTFGGYTIMIDTIPPTIKPYNIYANKNMSNNSSIIVSIADNLSGVKSYRGEIDGKWILMEYESKKAHLIHKFDNLPPGNHIFKLSVTDDVGNSTTSEIPFIR